MQILRLGVVILLQTLIAITSLNAQGYQVGSVVKDFNLPSVDGKNVSLSDFKNSKGFIIVFTCNACPYSKLYEERLNQLNSKYKNLGVHLIAINPNDPQTQPEDSFEKMKSKSMDKNLAYPYLYDENQKQTTAFNPSKTPHAFVITVENNNYKVVYSGAIDDNSSDAEAVKVKFVENAVDEVISGRKISVASSTPVGCAVKWKKR
jgi:peroxiredoxin